MHSVVLADFPCRTSAHVTLIFMATPLLVQNERAPSPLLLDAHHMELLRFPIEETGPNAILTDSSRTRSRPLPGSHFREPAGVSPARSPADFSEATWPVQQTRTWDQISAVPEPRPKGN